MLVSVLSVYVDGVKVGVGSSVTWCNSIFLVCDPVVTWNQLGEIEARWRDWMFSQIDASNVSVSAATSSQTQIGVIESVP